MHQDAGTNCGWAGPEFIEHVISVSERSICEKYEEMVKFVSGVANGKSGSHVAGVSAVALADAMIDTWFFRDADAPEQSSQGTEANLNIRNDSWERAKQMAAAILQEQMNADVGDVNENAVQFVVDWVLQNRLYFGEKAIGTCLGTFSESGNTAYIFPSALNQALTKAGYSARKTLKYMADNGLITSQERSDHKGKKAWELSSWAFVRY